MPTASALKCLDVVLGRVDDGLPASWARDVPRETGWPSGDPTALETRAVPFLASPKRDVHSVSMETSPSTELTRKAVLSREYAWLREQQHCRCHPPVRGRWYEGRPVCRCCGQFLPGLRLVR